MKLVEFTKEGLIVEALMKGPLRYKELKEKTRMSDAWLSRKLRDLQNLGVIISKEEKYYLEWGRFREALKHEKIHIARMIAQEIARTYNVVAVILFGSLARNQRKEADIDLLVVTLENNFNPFKIALQMLHRFSVAVDILHIRLDEMLRWFYEPPLILFGILSGYEILYDEGYMRQILKTLKEQILKNWTYIPEKELWLRKELLPHILKPQKNT
ncbi:MAG: Nucleotidyltransferase domain protein [Candidatus Bathyarchaeota archaeon BA2]|nr:MAG: Nucleotidyltransferase domain protein [Candidatus Bathyarchaeota archaeon BA2]